MEVGVELQRPLLWQGEDDVGFAGAHVVSGGANLLHQNHQRRGIISPDPLQALIDDGIANRLRVSCKPRGKSHQIGVTKLTVGTVAGQDHKIAPLKGYAPFHQLPGIDVQFFAHRGAEAVDTTPGQLRTGADKTGNSTVACVFGIGGRRLAQARQDRGQGMIAAQFDDLALADEMSPGVADVADAEAVAYEKGSRKGRASPIGLRREVALQGEALACDLGDGPGKCHGRPLQ